MMPERGVDVGYSFCIDGFENTLLKWSIVYNGIVRGFLEVLGGCRKNL